MLVDSHFQFSVKTKKQEFRVGPDISSRKKMVERFTRPRLFKIAHFQIQERYPWFCLYCFEGTALTLTIEYK